MTELSFAYRLRLDFSTGVVRSNKKMYATQCGGCLIIHPCGTVQFISRTWFEDVNADEL